MSGVGSTNAMKKGSGNNPFLAYTEEDMRNYLNSAYVGSIVKYTGPSTKALVTSGDIGDAQNLVVDLTKNFSINSNWNIGITIKNEDGTETKKCIMFIRINTYSGNVLAQNSTLSHADALIYSDYTPETYPLGRNINDLDVVFLAITNKVIDRENIVNWPIGYSKNGWQTNYFNDAGKITLWSYGDTVTAIQNIIDWQNSVLYTEPYVVNELYKVVYGGGQYYFEEFYYTSEYVTSLSVEEACVGKTFYDFTGTKQTGTGTKINPYLAVDVATFESFPKGSFIKWLGKNNTALSDGTILNTGVIYQGVDDGDTNRYILMPTLTNEGAASDLYEGKQLINSKGQIVTGTAVKEVLASYPFNSIY